MARTPDTKAAGASETAAGIYAARQSVQRVVGAASDTQGLQDGDVPGPIPNRLFDNTIPLFTLSWNVYIPSADPGGGTGADGFFPRALPCPNDAQLVAVSMQSDMGNPCFVAIARESGASQDAVAEVVASFAFTPAGSGRRTFQAVDGAPSFELGDIIIVTTLTSGPAPTVGTKLALEEFEQPIAIDLWFLPTAEPPL